MIDMHKVAELIKKGIWFNDFKIYVINTDDGIILRCTWIESKGQMCFAYTYTYEESHRECDEFCIDNIVNNYIINVLITQNRLKDIK